MFFSLEPQRFFPYAQIDVVQFPDDLGGDKIIEKIFKGPLHQQVRDALLYIRNNIITEQIIKYPDRAEADRFFNYPYAAVEESLCNAVYHKGYDVREPIEVRVLPDRMEIVSHPGADRSITEEGLRTYRVFNRRYRNRRIGEFLKEMHLTEGRNTGFRKIVNALEQNGSPKPVFETDPERLSFCTTLLIHPHFLCQNEGKTGIVNGGTSVSNVSNRVPNVPNVPNQGTALSELEEKIIALITESPTITSQNIAERCDVSRKTVTRACKLLKEKGIIAREGKTRGKWIILV